MARTFGGTAADAVSITGHTAIDALAAFTVSLWAARTGTGGGGFGRYIQKGSDVAREWVLYTDNSLTKQIHFEANRWATSKGVWDGSFIMGTAGAWHNVALTYDYGSTANNPIVYVDGAAVTTTRTTTPSGTDSGAHGDLFIGNHAATGGTANWAGKLAHVAIWNRVLSAGEIKYQYTGLPWRVPSGLITYLPLDGIASPEPNYAPQGNATRNGTVQGTVAATSPLGISRMAGISPIGEGAVVASSASGVRSFVAGMIG